MFRRQTITLNEEELRLPSTPVEDAKSRALDALEAVNEKIAHLEHLIADSTALLEEYRRVRTAHAQALFILENRHDTPNLPSPGRQESTGTLRENGDEGELGIHAGGYDRNREEDYPRFLLPT